MNKLRRYINFHARPYGHVRFKEPIVVFESDDWGLWNAPENMDLSILGKELNEWSKDKLESVDELDRLYKILDSFKNKFKRTPFFTANFVVSNPDFKATIASDYTNFTLKDIGSAFPETMVKWKEGISKQFFYPQYHARLHYNLHRYKNQLVTEEISRDLFGQHINGGEENYKATGTILQSEYQDFTTGERNKSLTSWVTGGLAVFKELFGYESTSTISPNYVIHPNDIEKLGTAGVKYLQGGNKVIFKDGQNRYAYYNYCLGKRFKNNVIALCRTVKFEPSRNKEYWQLASVKNRIDKLFQQKVPVIIDTHRINYVGDYANKGLSELAKLIEYFTSVDGLVFLSSSEIGQAIANKGTYTDVWTGESKTLTLMDNPLRKFVRSWVK